MTDLLVILNGGSVGLFGAVLSAAFCDIVWTNRKKFTLAGAMVILGILQMLVLVGFDASVLRFWYPVITHFPLMGILSLLSRKYLWSAVAVLAAYQCCQLRRWLALLIMAVFGGGSVMQASVELVVTIPLAYLLFRYAAPSVREVARGPISVQIQFGLIPVIGYLFDYLTRVYTDWLVKGVPAAVEFMPFLCALAYLVFVAWTSRAMKRQMELEEVQTVLNLQVREASGRIADMKKSQELTAAYRHDLRHHLQYLSSCLENGNCAQAQEYIRSLHEEISAQTVKQYCENTAVNLILSSFAGRAEELDVELKTAVKLGEVLRISDNDLCVLLSNALENALHSCVKVRNRIREQKERRPEVSIRAYEKEKRIFLEISNDCEENIVFEEGIPVTEERGHGIGIRSICAVIEKYGGIYSFERKDGYFLLRCSV